MIARRTTRSWRPYYQPRLSVSMEAAWWRGVAHRNAVKQPPQVRPVPAPHPPQPVKRVSTFPTSPTDRPRTFFPQHGGDHSRMAAVRAWGRRRITLPTVIRAQIRPDSPRRTAWHSAASISLVSMCRSSRCPEPRRKLVESTPRWAHAEHDIPLIPRLSAAHSRGVHRSDRRHRGSSLPADPVASARRRRGTSVSQITHASQKPLTR